MRTPELLTEAVDAFLGGKNRKRMISDYRNKLNGMLDPLAADEERKGWSPVANLGFTGDHGDRFSMTRRMGKLTFVSFETRGMVRESLIFLNDGQALVAEGYFSSYDRVTDFARKAKAQDLQRFRNVIDSLERVFGSLVKKQ